MVLALDPGLERADTDPSSGQRTSLVDVPTIALAARADEHLSKPVSLKQLVNVIEVQRRYEE